MASQNTPRQSRSFRSAMFARSGQRARFRRLVKWLIIAAGVFGRAPLALAGDFMDTRLSFTISDDNVLQGPQTTNPPSPSYPTFVGNQNNTQFYDNYETRYNGFENLTHLAIFKRMPSFFWNIDTEAGLVLRMQVLSDKSVSFGDAGSFLRLVFPLAGGNKDRNNINLVAFPLSSDRFRGGFSYAISWGGNPTLQSSLVPGVKLTLVQPNWYAYAGAKSSLKQRFQTDGTREVDSVFGLLGGLGIDFTETLTFEANGGYFDRGSIDKRELQTQSLQGFGGSAQLSFHRGLPIGTSIDFQLYRNDPDMQMKFFLPEIYDNSLSVVVKTEFTVLGQNLQDITRPDTTKVQLAMAGDVNLSAKYKKFRFSVDAVYRTLSFILYNVPSSPPYVDFPPGSYVTPEIFAAAGIDYFFAKAHLTPGFKVGVQMPASYRGGVDQYNQPTVGGSGGGVRTIIYRDAVNTEILDPSMKVEPIVAASLTLKWDISEIMSAAGQMLLRYDNNRTTLMQDPTGIASTRTAKLPPFQPGFNILLQARF